MHETEYKSLRRIMKTSTLLLYIKPMNDNVESAISRHSSKQIKDPLIDKSYLKSYY